MRRALPIGEPEKLFGLALKAFLRSIQEANSCTETGKVCSILPAHCGCWQEMLVLIREEGQR